MFARPSTSTSSRPTSSRHFSDSYANPSQSRYDFPGSRSETPAATTSRLHFPSRATTPAPAPAPFPTTRSRTYSSVYEQRRPSMWDDNSSTRAWCEEPRPSVEPPRRPASRASLRASDQPTPLRRPTPQAASPPRAAAPRASRIIPEETIYESESDTVVFPRSRPAPSTTHRFPPSPPRSRAVEEDVARIQSRIRERRQSEGIRMAEARAAAQAAIKDRESKDRLRAERGVLEAWTSYEHHWAALARSDEPITFAAVPWPVQEAPYIAADVTPAAIQMFLLSPLHSRGVSRKDRIRTALLRWHPDRFGRVMARVIGDDRLAVEEAVGTVARCLNELMAKEAAANARQQRREA